MEWEEAPSCPSPLVANCLVLDSVPIRIYLEGSKGGIWALAMSVLHFEGNFPNQTQGISYRAEHMGGSVWESMLQMERNQHGDSPLFLFKKCRLLIQEMVRIPKGAMSAELRPHCNITVTPSFIIILHIFGMWCTWGLDVFSCLYAVALDLNWDLPRCVIAQAFNDLLTRSHPCTLCYISMKIANIPFLPASQS